MKKIIASLLTALSLSAFAAGGGVAWDRFPPEKMSDMASLQNGAKLFANYCLNCHAAAFHRFNRLREIGLTEAQIKDNLMFTTEKVGETMKVAMDAKEAKEWFGATPPDLTLVARSRADGAKGSGADYLYTLWRSYYRDETKATGWDNLAFPSIGMPHVLWELQGERKPIFEERESHGHKEKVFSGRWEVVKPGLMTAQQYDSAVGDLVAYLKWMAEPQAAQRFNLGVWVLVFLGVFALFAWRLNAAYWKDVK
ncbi:ubiquinol-cytochrome c reductase cytochrome c1 subunit [Inhella inkyongensis]|uniref:Ubiquinol-cytochrome c reductase cytochrome c1 subunit n=1 Tax=Inhella inkyongensis TaxID=392593 RepID=A0A840S7X2_9BURK|nr:cytochrome c1 [Inhella inkyongensis]MBB5204540.1 ubiquinol-cytochrome c reductase cytochrome c1 subunit [Inhella inkyongensis]